MTTPCDHQLCDTGTGTPSPAAVILRIEDRHGSGYKHHLDIDISNGTQQGFTGQHIRNEEHYRTLRPAPEDDGIDMNRLTRHCLFGFASTADLQRWFLPADLRLGALLGGRIVRYRVDRQHILAGNRQVAFDARYARHKDSRPMDCVLEEPLRTHMFDFEENYLENISLEIPVPRALHALFGRKKV